MTFQRVHCALREAHALRRGRRRAAEPAHHATQRLVGQRLVLAAVRAGAADASWCAAAAEALLQVTSGAAQSLWLSEMTIRFCVPSCAPCSLL